MVRRWMLDDNFHRRTLSVHVLVRYGGFTSQKRINIGMSIGMVDALKYDFFFHFDRVNILIKNQMVVR